MDGAELLLGCPQCVQEAGWDAPFLPFSRVGLEGLIQSYPSMENKSAVRNARMSVRRVLSSVSFDVDPESVRQSPVIDTPVLHEVPWRELSEQKVSFAGGGLEKIHVS